MFDIVAMGELLIDFTPAGLSSAGNELFECNPGGAPANVLVALARLGGKGCFIGKVGNDRFGQYLSGVLVKNNVSTDGLIYSDEANTTLAFVHLDKDGDRSFSFYRKPGADLLMTFEEVETRLIDNSKIFHFGAVCLTDEPVRSACMQTAKYAIEKGIIVSFDPNWRPPLWKDDRMAKQFMLNAIELIDILKVSDVEMELLTGETDPEKGSLALFSKGAKLVFVTMGAAGCFYRCSSGTGHVPGFTVKSVDTTGAGDAFTAGMLYTITKQHKPIVELNCSEIYNMVSFANAVGALCVQKRGAIPAMPLLLQVESFITESLWTSRV